MSARVLLVGRAASARERWAKAELLNELAALVGTAGGSVVERLMQVRSKPDPATLVGRGMVERLSDVCREHDIELLVFDDELTPTQQRNIEGITDVRVVDRAAVILDIFAIHARTAEAKVQVELAQLEYRRTRLVGRGVEMSRLGGGIGTRGPGETKLEVDRRRIEQRIVSLRRELVRIERERSVQRRHRTGLFRVALAGYTNAGKSTLFNRLTDAGVPVSDRLFATLDASTRALDIDRHMRVLLTDTVGFIRNLPHQLVASFRSTLSDIRDSDFVLHVVDAGGDLVDPRIDTVTSTLEQIGAGQKPVLMVFNKTDRVFDEGTLGRLGRRYERSVFVSAKTGAGLTELRDAVRREVEARMVTRLFRVPADRWDIDARVRATGRVLAETGSGSRRTLRVQGDRAALDRLRKELSARPRGRTG